MSDNRCTYCGREGHRAHNCPEYRKHNPLRLIDLLLSILFVAVVAGVSRG